MSYIFFIENFILNISKYYKSFLKILIVKLYFLYFYNYCKLLFFKKKWVNEKNFLKKSILVYVDIFNFIRNKFKFLIFKRYKKSECIW